MLMNCQITGVSGFIGFKTLILALEAGYYVRAVVRKASQIPKLSNHTRIQSYVKNLEFVVIPDLAQTEAFDPALEGVIGILHLASPLAIEVCYIVMLNLKDMAVDKLHYRQITISEISSSQPST
jgi:uncharacterized protein YbjT (DUF2867 family)